jgi:hypothetical protein
MKNIKLSLLGIMATVVMLVLPASSTLASDRHSEESQELLISFDENFSACNGCIDGTTTLAGAFSDKGPRHQDNTVVSQSSDGKQVVVTGTVRITGSKGMLTTHYTGTIQFDGTTSIAYIEGVEFITGGTGAYAGARGKGTFEATIDFDTLNIVGVAELKVRPKD